MGNEHFAALLSSRESVRQNLPRQIQIPRLGPAQLGNYMTRAITPKLPA